MGFFSTIFGLKNDTSNDINPANGLPMLNDSIDIEGNPYGTDLSHDHFHDSSSSMFNDDLYDSSSSMFDDNF